MKRFVTLLLLLAGPALAADFPARVVGVSDGDTLTVLTAEKRQVKVRVAGIDAPETGQDFGTQAKKAASDLAFGKDVTVRASGQDRYGRTLAEVRLSGGRDFGLSMVSTGYAWHYAAYSHDPALAKAEQDARKARIGVWSHPNPTAPWVWRQGRGVPITAGVVGNRRSHLYHLPHCRGAAATKPENRVVFKTAAEAVEQGYRPAGDCR